MSIPSPHSIDYCNGPLLLSDLDFFDQEIQRYEEAVAESLVDKR